MNDPLQTDPPHLYWSRPRILAVAGCMLFAAGAVMPVILRLTPYRNLTEVDPYGIAIGAVMLLVALLWLRGLAWFGIAVDMLLGWQLYRSITDPATFQRTRPAWALLIAGAAVVIVAARWSLLEPHRSPWSLVRPVQQKGTRPVNPERSA